MLHFPVWKRVLIWGICALAILYAAPNFLYGRVESHNDAVAAIEKAGGTATPEQAEAVALWPDWLPSSIVNLGLDLRGGAHLLAEVRVEDVYEARMDGLWPEVRDALRGLRDQVGSIRRQTAPAGELRIAISRPEGMPAALDAARKLAQPVISFTGMGQSDIEVSSQNDVLVIRLTDAERTAMDSRTVQQSLEIIRRRVDEVGTREPTIQRQGEDRILIQVPGIGSAAELKSLIGTTAKLTFHPVLSRTAEAPPSASGDLVLPASNEQGIYYVLERAPVVTGEELVDAQPSFDQNNRPAVSFRFNPSGARLFGDYTAQNIGKPFAIVLDDEVISAPVIQAHIAGGSGIITGNFSVEESTELAVLLRAGALPAEMTFLEERTIGPELGQDSIDAGRTAAIVGMIAVVAFMIASYGWFGVLANIALAINMMAILALLSVIGATLTLPGIAGIVLTIGVAVDANVLIFERIREELRQGKMPARAIELGFQKAFSAILDANATTFLVAVIMFLVGAGPVRGFAVTLTIGIFTSVFTAVYVTRILVATWFAWRRPRAIVV
ncbi:protein translocase subunit SecD [Cereibacter azotoformans]|uniref:Protein translocase subunit SecD n=2 Tax=Cereibacter TaxID=1653176 RepID=A0A2T5KF07_9RHOB|nr:protein translocase subunit SecD [Cereibacter azotoformans]AXQ92690.1 protein translocase subunit SecD [Cereibacter sphaeroides]MBO4169722.1 protein translocase subunit SecD [Cereibacter azotoformans]PTR21018.1 preprotein translocase subunit SecD [Cereibacter azotoformans]UIJ30971.1 protein translocase subunit SecD [Cereibacter azotoformans]ULB08765.1 protein translocase subunit SecD [Cereibacter azotoformans]